jgi:hypothetical protein
LRTPTETRNAIAYVLFNAEKHYGSRQRGPVVPDPYSSAPYFDGFFELATFCRLETPKREAIGPPKGSSSDRADVPVTMPEGWLLRSGWRRSLGRRSPTEGESSPCPSDARSILYGIVGFH